MESMVVEPIKLNLGGRDCKIPGFKTVDLEESENTDINSDVSNLTMFRDGAVDEIYASNVLEHFPHTKTVDVLIEWLRVLKPGASAYISVPDFSSIVEIYRRAGYCEWVKNLLYGDQIYPLAYHYTCFTFPFLAAQLTKAGFSDVKRLIDMPFNVKDASFLTDNQGWGVRMCLNVRAIK